MNAFLLSTVLALAALAGPPADSTKSPHNGQAPVPPAPVGDKAPEVDSNAVYRMGDTVQLVGGGPRSEAVDDFVAMMGAGPPENDSHKWFISVVSMRGCSFCTKLKSDWGTAAPLLAFANPNDAKASWAHLNFYQIEDKSQEWRWKGIKLTSFPTILIQPPRDGSYGNPSAVAGQITGYSSPDKLAGEMTTWFKAYIAKHSERKRADLGPVKNGIGQIGQIGQIGIDPPWAPTPKVEPTVPTTPVVPNFPFAIDPPKQPVAPQVPGQVPSVAPNQELDNAVLCIYEPDGSNPYDDPHVKRMIDRMRGNKRVRLVSWSDVKNRFNNGVNTNAEQPAVIVTNAEGQVTERLGGKLLPVIRNIGIGDLPWSSFLLLFTGGFSTAAVLPIGIWLVKKIRAARVAAGQTPFVTDAQIDQGAALLAALLAKIQAATPADAKTEVSVATEKK